MEESWWEKGVEDGGDLHSINDLSLSSSNEVTGIDDHRINETTKLKLIRLKNRDNHYLSDLQSMQNVLLCVSVWHISYIFPQTPSTSITDPQVEKQGELWLLH